MNIWLISIFEQTPYDNTFSTRYVSIAEECLDRGHKVTFFGSTFRHIKKQQRFEQTTEIDYKEDYKLVFVKSPEYPKDISLKRLYSHYRLSKALVQEMEERSDRPDVILMTYPPISTVWEVTKWANKNRIPFVVDIIDPWPDSFRRVLNFLPETIQDGLLSIFTGKTKRIFESAGGIIGIAKQRLSWANKYYSKCEAMDYFYPAVNLKEMQDKLSSFNLEESAPKKEKLRIIYAGSLGSSYDIPTILKAAETLETSNKDIEFVIAGAGPQQQEINAYVKQHTNLKYLGRIPKEELMKEYAKSDLGLIQHHKGATQTVTYKLFDLLGAGLPILNSLESELNDILIENEVGLFNKPGDSQKLAENILYCYDHPGELKRMKNKAIEVTAEIGDTTKVYKELVDLLDKVAENNSVHNREVSRSLV